MAWSQAAVPSSTGRTSQVTLAPALRKLTLIIHVSSSVGWLGAIGAFLAVAITGLTTRDSSLVRSAYQGMNSIGWFVLVPISFASLLSGLIQALGTPWGLFRHYWVIFKLLINVLANAVLLAYMVELSSTVSMLSRMDAGQLRSSSPVLHASAALLLLLVAVVLSIYKPRGVTPYGWRKQQERRARARQRRSYERGVPNGDPLTGRSSRRLEQH
jgi:hypothetical protein